MIKINLLPHEGGKRAAGGGGTKQRPPMSVARLVYMGIAAVYLLAGGAAYLVYQVSADSTDKVKARQAEKETLSKRVERQRQELNEATANTADIEEKYEVAVALSPENRVFWSEKLNMLARARMNLGVYITRLQLTETVTEIETPESVARREEWKTKKKEPGEQEPKPIKRPIINQALQVDAIAYGVDDPQRLRQIIAFQGALQRLKWTRENGTPSNFLDGLKPEFGQRLQKRDIVGGVEVMQFGFVVEAEPQTDRTATISEGGK